MEQPVYIRLAVDRQDEDSGKPQGVFQAAYDLLEAPHLSAGERGALREVLTWFNANLSVPKASQLDQRAIFWFKPAAREAQRMVWQLAQLLRVHEVSVSVVTTTRPGYLIYEDDLQVAAIPFRDTL